MSTLVLTDCKIYQSGADLTGWSNKVDVSAKVADEKVTTFASGGWVERKGGLRETAVKVEGLWDVADGTTFPLGSRPDDRAWTDLGAAVPLTLVPTGGAAGDLAYLTSAVETAYSTFDEVGKLMPYQVAADGTWPLVRGTVLHPQGTVRTATGSGNGFQLGAVPAGQKLWVCLHVLSVSGTTPSITVQISSSVDNTFTSPTTQFSFAAATAIGGQTGTVAGPVTDTWWKAKWTITGTSPSFLFAVSAGISPA